MKLSLSWILDHIVGLQSTNNINALVERFNKTTAEISGVQSWKLELGQVYAVKVMSIDTGVTVACPETKSSYELEMRNDLVKGGYYLMDIPNGKAQWATLSLFSSAKEGLIPQVHIKADAEGGGWRKELETEDVIVEVDNKSITHRADLWSHRGVAREIAAYEDKQLVPLSEFLTNIEVKQARDSYEKSTIMPLAVKNSISALCKRFAGVYVPHVISQACDLNMLSRLARLDIRPINASVDATNYVMLDIGQPLHAFDASKISQRIEVRLGREKEKLTLLDGQTIELNEKDTVVSDRQHPLALAGVMGGLATAVNFKTKEIFVEAAYFEAASVRKSALFHKKRTDSSTRFEKSIDPMLNVCALQRYVTLLKRMQVLSEDPKAIISLGENFESATVKLSHVLIERKIGITVESDYVQAILNQLDFKVQLQQEDGELIYTITVPTYRFTKEPPLPEDIIEEIARFYGFERIERVLPAIAHNAEERISALDVYGLKEVVAYGLRAKEVSNYAVYDNSFLQKIKWCPDNAISILNPVSSNWQKLITSLIPHLIKNVVENASEHDRLRFFEYNRVWHRDDKGIRETIALSGILFDKRQEISFYQGKQEIGIIFDRARVSVSWEKADEKLLPIWFNPHQTASLVANGACIGYAGKINNAWLHELVDGDAFVFELDMRSLDANGYSVLAYQEPSKFPGTYFDVSMLIPLSVSYTCVERALAGLDETLQAIKLLDVFEKNEWGNKKSVTIRCYLQHNSRTLTKSDSDAVERKVKDALAQLQAEIR